MATKFAQLQSKLFAASQVASKQACTFYKKAIEENKDFIVDPPTVETCSELSKRLFYTRLASIPGRYESFWKELDLLKQKLKNRQDLKVEEVGVGVLFALECYAWGCVGEIVGRGFTITGYYP